MGRLQEKVAIVTGAGQGLGRSTALRFANEGAKVVVADMNRETAHDTVTTITSSGGEAIAVIVDVSLAQDAERMVTDALAEFGRIDVLVNNAGIVRDQLLMRMKPDEWDAVVATNLTAASVCCRSALRPMLKQRWGRIINISSVVGQSGNPGQTNYAASKAGLIGFTKSLAQEVASRGITVNVVAPGMIDTDMTAALDDRAREALLGRIPVGRLGAPEEIAAAVRFLASDEASYITGQVLSVNGGMYM